MHRFFVPVENILMKDGEPWRSRITDKDDLKHAVKALRIELGEDIELCDINGIEYLCEVIDVNSDEILCNVISFEANKRESSIDITLFQGMPKADKLEMIIQKTTELGILNITPVQMKRSVAKWKDDKSAGKKIERWNRIAFEASKQSKRGRIPTVNKPLTIGQLKEAISDYDLVILPYENESAKGIGEIISSNPTAKKVGIIIGPEGGFADEEVAVLSEAGAHSVKLGPRILRTETAGVVTVALVQYALGDLGGV